MGVHRPPNIYIISNTVPIVNSCLVNMHQICDMHEWKWCNLYNIPYCFFGHTVLSYRHKEVIPMYR